DSTPLHPAPTLFPYTTLFRSTVNRIIDAFPGNLQDQIRTQLSTALVGIVAQTLIPKIGGGRVAGYEILVVTSGIANLIRENKTLDRKSTRLNSSHLGISYAVY